jgi:16S rRNA (cytosine1402-N4)-methyltransferase
MMHIPVLLKEVIEKLNPQEGEFFVDGTLDGGGYAKSIIERISKGGVFLGIDWDEKLLSLVKNELEKYGEERQVEVFIENDNYLNILSILKKHHLGKADGFVLDLGFSSWHIEESGKGFSFNKEEPLILTYSRSNKLTAYEVVNFFPEKRLAEIIFNYGEEKKAKLIAKEIVRRRKIKKIETSKELGKIIEGVMKKRGKIHPATKTFQALRIYINEELENLRGVLEKIPLFMKKGGRIVVVSFHSLEDRIVKEAFKNLVKEGKAIYLNKKPICPSYQEIKNNPKSRSAKLRAIKFI